MKFGLKIKDLEKFLQVIPYAIAVINSEGSILQSNNNFERYICGSTQESNFYSLISIDASLLTEYFNSGETIAYFEANIHNSFTTPVLFVKSEDALSYLVAFISIPQTQSTIPQVYANQIFNDLNLGLIVVDRESRIVEISQVACKILGIKKHKVIGNTFREIFPEVLEEDLLISNRLFEGLTDRNKPCTWTTDGCRYELLVDSHLLYDDQGEIDGAYVIFKDVSNLRSIDEKIQRSDRLAMIGQIAAGTAHEIRNPLTSIRGFLQILSKSLHSGGLDKEKGYVDLMLIEIKRINSLVDQFLLLSKPRDVQYKQVDLNEVLVEIIPIVQNEAILYDVEIINETTGKLPLIIGNSELLKQVFLNVCKNGMEAIVRNGKVTISHEYFEQDKKVSINIHDTGPGIPSYIIDRIFDPFFTTKDEGTGLGLSVCQRIVQDIGGSIRVSNKGYGTVFHIILPYLHKP